MANEDLADSVVRRKLIKRHYASPPIRPILPDEVREWNRAGITFGFKPLCLAVVPQDGRCIAPPDTATNFTPGGSHAHLFWRER